MCVSVDLSGCVFVCVVGAWVCVLVGELKSVCICLSLCVGFPLCLSVGLRASLSLCLEYVLLCARGK